MLEIEESQPTIAFYGAQDWALLCEQIMASRPPLVRYSRVANRGQGNQAYTITIGRVHLYRATGWNFINGDN